MWIAAYSFSETTVRRDFTLEPESTERPFGQSLSLRRHFLRKRPPSTFLIADFAGRRALPAEALLRKTAVSQLSIISRKGVVDGYAPFTVEPTTQYVSRAPRNISFLSKMQGVAG